METQTIKRLLITAVAGVMLAGPLTAFTANAQQGRYDNNRQNNDRHDDRDNNRHYDRHDGKHWRDDRRDQRWDERQHNGYYENRTWRRGPPPANAYGRPGFSLGYQPWERGQRLGYYNTRYVEVDYRRQNLKRPQRGYRWVQDDRGDYLLAAIATGLIAAVVINGGR